MLKDYVRAIIIVFGIGCSVTAIADNNIGAGIVAGSVFLCSTINIIYDDLKCHLFRNNIRRQK